jgi:hypothetical protein
VRSGLPDHLRPAWIVHGPLAVDLQVRYQAWLEIGQALGEGGRVGHVGLPDAVGRLLRRPANPPETGAAQDRVRTHRAGRRCLTVEDVLENVDRCHIGEARHRDRSELARRRKDVQRGADALARLDEQVQACSSPVLFRDVARGDEQAQDVSSRVLEAEDRDRVRVSVLGIRWRISADLSADHCPSGVQHLAQQLLLSVVDHMRGELAYRPPDRLLTHLGPHPWGGGVETHDTQIRIHDHQTLRRLGQQCPRDRAIEQRLGHRALPTGLNHYQAIVASAGPARPAWGVRGGSVWSSHEIIMPPSAASGEPSPGPPPAYGRPRWAVRARMFHTRAKADETLVQPSPGPRGFVREGINT